MQMYDYYTDLKCMIKEIGRKKLSFYYTCTTSILLYLINKNESKSLRVSKKKAEIKVNWTIFYFFIAYIKSNQLT